MPKQDDLTYELPCLEDENIWEKIPLSRDGVQDLVVDFSNDPPFILRTLGTAEPERRVGKVQIYKKIDSDIICYAYSFFDDSEPAVLCWFKENRKILIWALKMDGVWIVARPPEQIILYHISTVNYGVKNPSCDAFIFIIYNSAIKKSVFGKIFLRGSE